MPLIYLNNGTQNVAAPCAGPLCHVNITVYRFSWAARKDFLTQPDAFNPPNASGYPFSRTAAQLRQLEGQMMLIEDGPGRDAADMQSMLIDQFGLVYEPLDFYIPNMRGVGSSMDSKRAANLTRRMPLHSRLECSSSVSTGDFAPDHLMPCIQEANLKYATSFVHCLFVTLCACTETGWRA
jgi:hypothetical protein